MKYAHRINGDTSRATALMRNLTGINVESSFTLTSPADQLGNLNKWVLMALLHKKGREMVSTLQKELVGHSGDCGLLWHFCPRELHSSPESREQREINPFVAISHWLANTESVIIIVKYIYI